MENIESLLLSIWIVLLIEAGLLFGFGIGFLLLVNQKNQYMYQANQIARQSLTEQKRQADAEQAMFMLAIENDLVRALGSGDLAGDVGKLRGSEGAGSRLAAANEIYNNCDEVTQRRLYRLHDMLQDNPEVSIAHTVAHLLDVDLRG